MAEAKATTLPATSIARSRACISAHSVTHGREHNALTSVKQEHAQITAVSTFQERLKAARIAAGFSSQAKLARAAGVSPGAVGNWEAGTREQPRDLLDLARVLRVSPEWLAKGVPATHQANPSPLSEGVAHEMSESRLQTVAPMT